MRALLEDRVTAAVATGGPTAYVVTLTHAPTAYTDGMALNVRFPLANLANPTLDIRDPDGNLLGAKPIKQVDGTDLSAGHVAANARGELYYVSEESGYWTLGAGARGATGPAGPPDGTFSLNSDKELVFSPDDGMSNDTNFGPVAPLNQGDYSSSSTYSFLHIVHSGSRLYLHIGTADTTGTAVTDTAVWQPLARDGYDAAIAFNFSASTTMSDPAAGDIRLNNASPGSVTRIAVDDADADGNTVAGYINSFDDTGVADGHGTLFIRDVSDDDLLIYRVDSLVDNTGWTRLNVTHVAGTALPSNDARLAVWFVQSGNKGIDGNLGIPTGTRMLFYQASAPTGWTKVTSVNDRLLRAVSGSGGSTGGNWEISGLSIGGTALLTSQMPSHSHGDGTLAASSAGSHSHGDGTLAASSAGSHSHTVPAENDLTSPAGSADYAVRGESSSMATSTAGAHSHPISGRTSSGGSHSHGVSGNTGAAGGGATHTHTIAANGNWRPAYADVIVCSRDA